MSHPSLRIAASASAGRTSANALRERNAGASINRLPDELLLDILGIALGLDSERARGRYHSISTIEYYRGLRELRLVAWGWSCLIDNSPELWAKVDPFDPEESWRMALRKSQDALVDVYCQSSHRSWGWDQESRK
ncbi:hypothetical protein FRB90_007617, partial [Tulasnella sp. 427]